MKEVRRIDPWSVFKMGAVLYLILGGVFAVVLIVFGAGAVGSVPFGPQFGQLGLGVLGTLIGTVVYALIGGGSWALLALGYNLLVKKLGGIRVELL